jgi:hypothetical protein
MSQMASRVLVETDSPAFNLLMVEMLIYYDTGEKKNVTYGIGEPSPCLIA